MDKVALSNLLAQIHTWAAIDNTTGEAFLTKRLGGENPPLPQADGDVLSFSGMLAQSGEAIAVSTASRCQALDGSLWRSPKRVKNDPVDSASRDQLLGFLGYLVTIKDVPRAELLISYLKSHSMKLCYNATDNKGGVTPQMMGLMSDVWSYIGAKGLPWYFWLCRDLVWMGMLISALFSPVSYQTELVAEQILLYKTMNGKVPLFKKLIARILRYRDSDNAFYNYLCGDVEKAASLVLSQAPMVAPKDSSVWVFAPESNTNQFQFSMGWDFIFLINLLLKS